nr:RNA-dependent RNA polymerase [Marmot picobirnavirus]
MSKETLGKTPITIDLGDYCYLPNANLSSYFHSVKVGKGEIERAPFGGTASSPSKQLDEWHHIFTAKLPHAKWSDSLQDFEFDQMSKVGPMSVRKPLVDRLPDIVNYYTDVEGEFTPVAGEAVLAALQAVRPAQGIRLRTKAQTIANMDLSKNSGTPYYTSKRVVTPEYLSRVGSVGYSGQHVTSMGKYAAAILGWRGQEGGPKPTDTKQRVVWMFPYGVNIAELSAYQPLITSCQRHGLIAPWISDDLVDSRITRLFDTKSDKDLVVCTDFTRFDQHFGRSMQDCAEDMMRALLVPSTEANRWIERVFPIKYNLPIIISPTQAYTGWHGMGSGSGGTNVDETLAHTALQHEAALLNGEHLNPNSMCLGDDGVLSYPGVAVDQVTEAYTSHGLEMNEIKQYAKTDSCVFLRRWHHTQYRQNSVMVGVYSTFRALGRLMYTERGLDGWTNEDIAMRQLSILENTRFHPLFKEFVSFAMRKDKYRLGLDLPGFWSKVTSDDPILKAGAWGKRQEWRTSVQSVQRPISSWAVVRLLDRSRPSD